jgi:uncharacterized damage-inducible protein DinB
MRRQDLQVLFDFTYWMRDRILERAARLASTEFTAPSGVTTRNLRGTLVHTLDVEFSWRARLRGEAEAVWKKELAVGDYPTVGSLAEHWRRDEAEMRAWLAALDDAELAREFVLDPAGSVASGERYPLWYYVLHVHTHSHQQLADAAVLLTRMRQSPGNLEFLDFADHLHGRARA